MLSLHADMESKWYQVQFITCITEFDILPKLNIIYGSNGSVEIYRISVKINWFPNFDKNINKHCTVDGSKNSFKKGHNCTVGK